MTMDQGELGTIEKNCGVFVARPERVLNHVPEPVGRMLTEPNKPAKWFACGNIELIFSGLKLS